MTEARQVLSCEAMKGAERETNTSFDSTSDARHYGIDVDLIESNLELSYEARIERHQAALELVQELLVAREALYSRP